MKWQLENVKASWSPPRGIVQSGRLAALPPSNSPKTSLWSPSRASSHVSTSLLLDSQGHARRGLGGEG